MTIKLTAQLVKESYDKHPELKPRQGNFYKEFYVDKDDASTLQCSVCALSIVYIDVHGFDNFKERYHDQKTDGMTLFYELTGWNEGQLWAFINGFDSSACNFEEAVRWYNSSSSENNREEFKLGYDARNLVFGEDSFR